MAGRAFWSDGDAQNVLEIGKTYDEDHGYYSTSGAMVMCLSKDTTASSLDGEENRHANEGHEILTSPPHLASERSTDDASDKVRAGQAQVELILHALVGDANSIQHLGEVVRDKTVTRPLAEDTDASGNEDTLAVARSLEELDPFAL